MTAVMKRFTALLLTVLTLMSPAAFAEGEISVFVDGERVEFDVEPQIINDRTMVPMRRIFEKLGAEVEWVPDSQMIFSTKGAVCVLMQIGKSALAVKDFISDSETRVELDCAPLIADGRTLVPVRAVSEAFGLDVQWDGEARSVLVTSRK